MALRSGWDAYIRVLAPALACSMAEVDPVGSAPESTENEGNSGFLRFVD